MRVSEPVSESRTKGWSGVAVVIHVASGVLRPQALVMLYCKGHSTGSSRSVASTLMTSVWRPAFSLTVGV